MSIILRDNFDFNIILVYTIQCTKNLVFVTVNHAQIKGGENMKHIRTIGGKKLTKSVNYGGCGECQTSCQSACKTSCTVGNQKCENPSSKE